MGLKDLSLNASYDTGDITLDVVRDFYEPCLDEAVSYDRLSGYFSSRVIALAARGMGGFIQGHGRMRLITSANFSAQDLSAILSSEQDLRRSEKMDQIFALALEDRFELESLLEKHHLDAMCWLLREGRLEIKVVLPVSNQNSSNAIFHSKVGIFEDSEQNAISFSGSVNETLYGWTQNIEEFKVFKSWEDATQQFVDHDKRLFEKYWTPTEDSGFVTVPLPEATKMRLIELAPADAPDLKSYTRPRKKIKDTVRLRDYQLSAIEEWEKANFQGIFEMATGTGKTKTASACIQEIQKRGSSLTVITAPYQHIAAQWVKELAELGPVLASGNSDWEATIKESISRIKLGRISHVVVVAVQNTAASRKFIELTNQVFQTTENFLFVGDEVHGLGATSFQAALNPNANFRLGLSATPERYFDEVGTSALSKYFHGTCYKFGTAEALTWIDPLTGQTPLCPYEYFPIFVSLSADETVEYEKLSDKIRKLSNTDDFEQKQLLERLLFKRASILKTAHSKFGALDSLLRDLSGSVSDCLIYCNDFNQLLEVASILTRRGISYQKITGDEGSSPEKAFGNISERDWILKNFADGHSQVLLAIKCLDEGVDIPSAKIGIILASSGNPREFIQRRGRLMRRFPGKSKSVIYDFVVSPPASDDSATGQDVTIFRKELERIDEFAKDALNRAIIELTITKKLGEAL